jgi:hypothetical protein
MRPVGRWSWRDVRELMTALDQSENLRTEEIGWMRIDARWKDEMSARASLPKAG